MTTLGTQNLLIVQGLVDYAEGPTCAEGDDTLKAQLLALLRLDRMDSPRFQQSLDELLENLLNGPHAPAVQEILARLPGQKESTRALDSADVREWALDPGELASMRVGLQTDLSAQVERQECDFEVVPVFFVTDRSPTGKSEPRSYFSGGRGELQFGYAEVSIPDRHRRGRLEQPPWYLPLVKKNPTHHVALLDLTLVREGEFSDHVRSAAGRSGLQQVLVFIHGYNVSFESAARRAAQLCYDLQFRGIPVLYSWPSTGRWYSYTVDVANVESTFAHFLSFMTLIRSLLPGGIIHLLAHSMGNRLLRDYVEQPEGEGDERLARLGEVIMAAPDVDAQVFRDTSPASWGTADHFTLYASSRDWPLRLSKLIHGYDRAGDSGDKLVIIDRVDAIDATRVGTSLFGHSYYCDAASILSDVFLLLRHGLAPGQRPALAERRRDQAVYWEYLA